MIFIAIDATSSVQKHHALLDVMFICTLFTTLILSAKLSHMIKFVTFKTLCDMTVFFK